MNKGTQITLTQSLLCWLFIIGGLTYFSLKHGTITGSLLFFLLWSFYIICLPGGHGQLLFGFPLRRLTTHNYNPEVILWPAALLFNLAIYLTYKQLYFKTFLTTILYRILTVPVPHWSIIIASAIGTFYYYIVGEKYFACTRMQHKIIRHLLIIAGIIYFFCTAYKDFIVLLTAKA